MRDLKNLLARRKDKVKISLTDKDVFYIFNRVVKEEFGNVGVSKLMPEFFKNKTVFVRATSAVWASELFSNREMVVGKMNEELGEGMIREIRIK